MRFAIPSLVVAGLLCVPERAEACGGTFCDGGGPNPSSVDQAYETVLFVQDGPFVEAHIQIAIDPNTDAQQFAWVVPMPAVPELSVGSQPLFDALLRDTSPRYDARGESCGWSGFIQEPDGGGASYEPDVIETDVVGAFEVTVLQGGTVEGVMTWLGDNGYTQDPAAGPILGEYIDAGHVLVAFKLAPSAITAEVHPVVLRYEGDEPCVPLRLTAIAATPDMGVRAFVLGTERWAPANWKHVVPNVVKIPWTGSEFAYADAIARAVDEAPGGRGFVTEYAGPSDTVVTDAVWSPTWDASVFETADPTEVVTLLNAQGLSSCDANLGPCLVPYPLVVAMLRKYLPAPPDANENDFYSCLSCYADQTDFADWDGPAFAAELAERVIEPGLHGVELVQGWPYLTRLFTRVSAEEMTVDPIFHATPDLPDVPLPGAAAEMCLECEEDAVATLPDGRMVYMPGSSWPTFAEMPWAERIETIPPKGAPMVELNQRATIDALLAAWNGAQECDVGSTGTDDNDVDGYDEDDSGPATAEGGNGSAGDGGTTGGDGSGSGSAGQGDEILGRGCGCRTGTTSWSAAAWALVVLVVRRRRR